MEYVLFKDLIIILTLSVFVLLVGHQLKLPPVVGFILTGVLSGPHGLGLVKEIDDVEILAQIGIVLLLFGIGMEFSYKKLVQIKRLFLLGGALQVGLTILAGVLIGQLFGRPLGESFFLGCLLSMSSTAIVLRLLEQQGQVASPHGRLAVAILIFQDLIAIPIVLFTPFLGQNQEIVETNGGPLWLVVKGIAILVLVFFSAQRLVPRLLRAVARTRNKELFLMCVLALCFSVAWLTSSIGLSLTIGAFLAGLVISESEYSNEAISHIFPFQALFVSFFFISIGMLLDIKFVIQQPFYILFLAMGVLLLKTVTASIAAILVGMPIRIAILVGIALSQIGEFSFVIAKTGIPYGLGSEYLYQLFLAVSLLTLAVSPVFVGFSSKIAAFFSSLPLPKKLKTGLRPPTQENTSPLVNHIIIIGFGVSGKNLARSSTLSGIPYTVLEMNPDTVHEQKKLGEPIQFGDATHLEVLEHASIQGAKAIAVLINDPIAARRIVKVAREANPSVYIIVRARYVQEMPLFANLGADDVIPDEFGTSIEVFTRVMRQYFVPQDEIEKFINNIRADGYEQLRDQHTQKGLFESKLNLAGLEVNSFRIHPLSGLVGKTLAQSDLRKVHGLTVLLIRRGTALLASPGPETVLQEDDILVMVGNQEPLPKVRELFGQAALYSAI